ncbi:MAG: primosomal protein N' [Anaerolineae bacterium]|nr:primosomal protein N' [Anaerolineae bacterium]
MTTFVEVVVNIPQVSGVFHYHLPPELEGTISAGHLVTVPFGRQTVQGVVLQTVTEASTPETRPVMSLLDPQPVLSAAQIQLAQHIATQSLTPLAACLSLMLPPGLSQMADTLYALTPGGEALIQNGGRKTEDGAEPPGQTGLSSPAPGQELTKPQWKLLALLAERGPLRGRQIDHHLPRKRWRATAGALARRGLLTSQAILTEPTVSVKKERMACLLASPDEAVAQMDSLGRSGSPALARRQKMLQALLEMEDTLPAKTLYKLSGGNSADLKQLATRGLIAIEEVQVWRDPLAGMEFVAETPPELTRAQADVWAQVQTALRQTAAGESAAPCLLYGVTGSGKTEIYLRAVAETLQQGRQAIILVPEIALTPQTVRRFVARFPERVGLVHSGLSAGERYDTWRRARNGEIDVVVGPRSALFTPFADVGLIVVDECHDGSYYQGEPAPSYHAREAAATYALQVGAVCLMGSATPDVVSTYRAARGEWTPLSLPDRILAHKQAIAAWQVSHSRYQPLEHDAETIDLPPVEVVDMRAELKAGNRSIFSQALQDALVHVLEHGQQAILFLNRRGTATYVFCRECGYSLQCPRCDIPLTYHVNTSGRQDVQTSGRPDALICHRCNYRRKMPAKCPQCGGTKIRQYGTGTEKVESEVQALFPGARTLRWDWSTTRKKGSHDAILSQFAAHEADVLVGTQMLAKGLDLPLVTLVGAVLADVGLNLPDYRATERVFQVLTQVAGRAGRSPLGGQMILQTFEPEHYVILAASQHSYREFYRQEIAYRRELGYPPFARLVRLEFRGQDAAQVEESAQSAARQLAAQDDQRNEIIGPVPCFFSRVSGIYRWQIVLRGPNPTVGLDEYLLKSCRVEVDPISLL